MKCVGIDIGSFSIKLAEVEASGKTFRLLDYQEYPLSQDPTKDNDFEILDILRGFRQRYDESTRFVFAVKQGQVSFRRLTFPFRERHKILKSLPFELEEVTPFGQDDAVFDARISRFVGNQADVLAATCPTHHIERILATAKDAGIEPDLLTTESMALANLFEEWREAPLEDQLPNDDTDIPAASPCEVVLDIGHSSTQILFFQKGYLLDAHNVDWGGRDLANGIAKKYSIHIVEATKELCKKSFILLDDEGATKDQIAFSDIIKGEIGYLAQQIQFIIMDMRAQNRISIENILLMGGTSQIKNLGAYLTQQFEIPVNRVAGVMALPGLDLAGNPNHELNCATAIGMAAEAVRKPKNPPLNLLRGPFAKQGQHFKLIWEKWNHAIIVTAAIFVVMMIHGITREQFAISMSENAYDQLQQQAKSIANLSAKKANEREIQKFIKAKKKEREGLKFAANLQNISSALDIVQNISLMAPSKQQLTLDITRFVVDNDVVEIEGRAAGVGLAKFESTLRDASRNNKVEKIASSLKAKGSSTPFAYRFLVQRKSGGER